MRFSRSLSDLPFSLLITSFALAVAAVPVHTAVLTPETFAPTIEKGVWLIEHFSPYCGHCRSFAPTWDKLVENNEKASDPGIHLAQVNCAANGDLCDKNGVKGYPQIHLYRDGEFVEKYKGSRDYDLLVSYLGKHAKPTGVVVDEAAPTTTVVPALHVQTTRAVPNPSGTVVSLDDKTFTTVVNEGPTFVKFFAPWCGHCKKLAPIWKQLARHLQNKVNVVEVNCEDHGSLCKSQGVEGYPMLAYYSDGARTEYLGGRKIDQLKSFAEKASEPPVQEIKPEDLETHIADNDVVYVLVHSSPENPILAHLTKAAHVLLGTPPVFTCQSSTLLQRFDVPSTAPWALLAFKDHDFSTPTSIYHVPSTSEASLSKWLLENRLPTSAELMQDTFQEIMNAPHRPLVVIAAVTKDTKEKVEEKFKDIGKKWKLRTGIDRSNGQRAVVFTWMDAEKWASWMKSMYGIKAGSDGETPVVIADHKKLIYYDQDTNQQPLKLTSTSLFAALEAASKGELTYKNSENFVERMARFLNEKILSTQAYVIEHPWHAAFFFVAFLVLLFFVVRRLLGDDPSIDGREYNHLKKSGRLD